MEENRPERRLANFAAGREAGPHRVKGEIAGAGSEGGKDGSSLESSMKLQSWPPLLWGGGRGGGWVGAGGALRWANLGSGVCRVCGWVGNILGGFVDVLSNTCGNVEVRGFLPSLGSPASCACTKPGGNQQVSLPRLVLKGFGGFSNRSKSTVCIVCCRGTIVR